MRRVMRLCCVALPLVFCDGAHAAQGPFPSDDPLFRTSAQAPYDALPREAVQCETDQCEVFQNEESGPFTQRARQAPGIPRMFSVDAAPLPTRPDDDMRSRDRGMHAWLTGTDRLDEHTVAGVKRAMYDIIGAPMEKDTEYAFVSMMIGHHTGALSLAVEAMLSATSEEMLALSRNAVVAKLDEIVACKQWLREHKR